MIFSTRNSILRIGSTIKRLKKSMNLKFKIDFQFFFFSMVRKKTASLWYSKQFHNWSKYFSIFAPIKFELKARNTAKILWLVCIECRIFYELDNWNNQKNIHTRQNVRLHCFWMFPFRKYENTTRKIIHSFSQQLELCVVFFHHSKLCVVHFHLCCKRVCCIRKTKPIAHTEYVSRDNENEIIAEAWEEQFLYIAHATNCLFALSIAKI